MEKHSITPPPELVLQWLEEFYGYPASGARIDAEKFLAARAAQWGADQELEACCECITQWYRAQSFLKLDGDDPVPLLRIARRPKPPSLAEEALELVTLIQGNKKMWQIEQLDVVRRALERLQELEGANG